MVENLAWSNNRLLSTCEEPLRNKILKRLVGVDTLDLGGGALVLKIMLNIIMDVNDIALRALTQSLQNFASKTSLERTYAQQ